MLTAVAQYPWSAVHLHSVQKVASARALRDCVRNPASCSVSNYMTGGGLVCASKRSARLNQECDPDCAPCFHRQVMIAKRDMNTRLESRISRAYTIGR